MRSTTLHAAISCIFFNLITYAAAAQCPQVEAIMVDACGTEQLNEFIIIHSGAGFNTSDLQLSFDASNNFGGPQNNDINMDLNNDPGDPTPCGLQPGNPAMFTGCSNVTAVGAGFDIPANSIVILQTSANSSNNLYNFSTLCGAGQCIFVISSSCARLAGGFTNGGGGMRTSIFQINGGCVQTITYNLALLVGGNGAYYLPLTNTYGNAGCVVPPSSPAPPAPSIDPIADVTVCGEYTLPAITGQNLTPNAAYFTGPNRTGTQLDPGDVISSTTTLFAHDFSGANCDDEEPFTVTINPLPSVNQPNDVEVCAGQTVNVPFSGSPGATYGWTNDNTAIGLGASGNGTINFPAANVSTVQVATITVTPTQGPCTGDPVTFTITINPRPTVNPPGNQVVCAGEQVDVLFSGSGNPTYNWTNTNTAIGLGSSGNGDISFTAAMVGNTTTGTITVNATENGCAGPNQIFTITVNPLPLANQPNDVTVCAGATVNVPVGGTPGATFNWTNDNTAIGLGASGSGGINFPSANVSTQQVATITIIPRRNNCDGDPVTFTITVNPLPTLDNPGDQIVCSGENVFIQLTGDNNPIFDWINSDPAIGLPAFGNGDISFTAAVVGANTTGTISVTPVLGACVGPEGTFTITVVPGPSANQPSNVTVCGGAAVNVMLNGTPGATFSWTNSNPAIGLGGVGTGNISFNSSNPATTQTATITVTPSLGNCTGTARTFTITINPRPVSNMPNQVVCAGDSARIFLTGVPATATWNWTNSDTTLGLGASGVDSLIFRAANVSSADTGLIVVSSILGVCAGAPDTFLLIVAPSPMADVLGDQTFCIGDSAFVTFSGSPGAIFNWTNNNPAIGLPAGGTGNLSFLAAGDSATVRVVPVIGSCVGDTVEFDIAVVQPPGMNAPLPVTACDSSLVQVVFSGTPGAMFTWTNSNPNIGLPAAGSGDLSFTGLAPDSVETAVITVIPALNSCSGPSVTFNITIRPRPRVNAVPDIATCGADSVHVLFNGTAGAVFDWMNNNPNIGLPAAGTGNIDFLATNLPDAAVVVVTATLNGCIGPADTFGIQIVSAPVMNPLPDMAVCPDDTLIVSFSGTPGAQYAWTNSNPAIGLPAGGNGNLQFTAMGLATSQTAVITVTPQLGACTGPATAFNIEVNPLVQAQISGPAALCAGDTALLTATGGNTYLWNTGDGGPNLSVSPDTTTLFTVTAISAEGCNGIDSFLLNILQPDQQTVFQTSCNPADTGLVVTVLSNQLGCDSIITAITTLLPTDTLLLSEFTCDPAAAGVFTQILANQFGCDSVLITTRVLAPRDTVAVNLLTCDPAAAGVFTQTFTNQFGCDSLIITAVSFDPLAIDTTFLSAVTCDPAAVGVSTLLLTGADNCDSVIITTTALLPPDTTFLSATTCNPASAGVFTTVLTNTVGCDSVLITTVNLLPTDTTQINGTTCNAAQAGVFTNVLSNQFGCDSVIVRTVSLLPSDTTQLSASTCNPAQAGVFTTVLSNQSGCDSVVIRTVSLLPSDTVLINGVTCNPAAVGVFTTVLNNQFGCDSVVIINVFLFPSDTTLLSATTCNPAQAGVFTQKLFNAFGCDSVIITTVALLPSDTIFLDSTTCDPAAAGVFTEAFTNAFGCDSLIITTITLDPTLCILNVVAQSTPADCAGNAAGGFRLSVFNGQPPYQFTWTGSGGNNGSGQIPAITTPISVSGLPAGLYSVTVTDAGGLLDTVLTITVAEPPALSVSITILTPYNGFALGCSDSADGMAQSQVSGGTPDYQFAWSNNESGSQINNLTAGNIQLTVTDQNGCTAIADGTLAAPPPIGLDLNLGLADCGDTLIDLTVLPSGGAGNFEIRVDGNIVSGLMPALNAGLHDIELRDANGCTKDTSILISLPPAPAISLPADTIVQVGATLVVTAQTNLLVWDSLYWSPLPEASCPACLRQEWQPVVTAPYTVTIVDTFGCMASATILVGVDKTRFLYIPNAFSPNDDGFNDFFQLGAGPGIADLEFLQIYDRWGGLLYDLDAPVPVDQWSGWDGNSRDKEVTPGVYIYYLRVRTTDGAIVEKSGDVTVIR